MNKSFIIVSIILFVAVALGIYYLYSSQINNIHGMKIQILNNGAGQGSKMGDLITVNYVGTLENGQKFDSSFDRKQPFQFTLGQGQVIQGWDLGLLDMKVGEKRKLTIPPELGYGSQGAGNLIPPNATLIFEVEMLKIESPK